MCFFCPDLQISRVLLFPPHSFSTIIHTTSRKSCKYSPEGHPLTINYAETHPEYRGGGNPFTTPLTFSTFFMQSLAWGSIQENLPSLVSFVLIVSPLVHLGLLSFLLLPHLFSPLVSRICFPRRGVKPWVLL